MQTSNLELFASSHINLRIPSSFGRDYYWFYAEGTKLNSHLIDCDGVTFIRKFSSHWPYDTWNFSKNNNCPAYHIFVFLFSVNTTLFRLMCLSIVRNFVYQNSLLSKQVQSQNSFLLYFAKKTRPSLMAKLLFFFEKPTLHLIFFKRKLILSQLFLLFPR